MTDLQANKETIRAFFRHLSAGDVEGVLGVYADDFVCWTAGSLPFSGEHPRDEVAALVSGVTGVFPDGLAFTVVTLTAEDDRVSAIVEGKGVHMTGRIYDQRYHFLFTLRDGKIRAMREYFDTAHADEVLCSAPAPGFNE